MNLDKLLMGAGMRKYILRDKVPVEVENWFEWAKWSEENWDSRIVGYTKITNHMHVSTIFLGLDHRFFGLGPPILFETIIFGGPLDEEQTRYGTYEQAEQGHRDMVARAEKSVWQKLRKNKRKRK